MKLRRAITLLLLLTAAAESDVRAADDRQLATALARYVDESAIAVVHIDLDGVGVSATIKEFAELSAEGLFGQIPDAERSFAACAQALRDAGARHVFVVFAPAPLSDRNPYLFAMAEPGRELNVEQADKRVKVIPLGKVVFVADKSVVSELRSREPAFRPALRSALASAGTAPIAVLIVPSADQRRALEESLSSLPPFLGAGPATVLTRGLQWATLRFDPSTETAELAVKSRDGAAAVALRDYLRDLPGKIAGADGLKSFFPEGRLPDALVPTVKGDTLSLTVRRSDPATAALAKTFAEAVRKSAVHSSRRDQIKQIAIGMHNYHDVHNRFPAAGIYDKNGKPLLSWRVTILPFVADDGNQLYKEFHLDEPWDSEHNKKLISRIPSVYRPGELTGSDYGKTTILGVTGKRSLFHDRAGTRIRDIADGTSNTLMIVDAAPKDAVIWTQPADFDADGANVVGRFFGGRDEVLAGMCDGSVRRFPAAFARNRLDEKLLRALMTINGGEPIPWD